MESFSEELEGGLEYPHYTRPEEFRGWRVPDVLRSGDHGRIEAWRREQEPRADGVVRGPIDRLTGRIPPPWRTIVDWVLTIVIAVGAVLAIKQWVVNPYRIPSSSMEPTLHCAEPGDGCTARFSDRVLANRFIYHLRDPERGDVVVFDDAAAGATALRRQGGTFVKRLVGLARGEHRATPGRRLDRRRAPRRVVHRGRAARRRGPSRPATIPDDHYFFMGDNRSRVVRQPRVGSRAAREPDRRGLRRLLASAADRLSLEWPPAHPAGASFTMSKTIDILERRQLRSDIPDFKAGDTVRVHFQVIEGQRRRVQVFEGHRHQAPGCLECARRSPSARTRSESVSSARFRCTHRRSRRSRCRRSAT